MIRYHFDLYDDPEGALLVRFTQLQSAEYQGQANGTGAGRITIRATEAEAQFIDPNGLQYIRVVRDDESTELVIGGFFTERGSYSILSGTSDKLLSIGGAGPLSYLQRAVMDADSWIDDPFIGHDPQPDGTWPLHLAGTGNELGAILWRILHELEEPGRWQNPLPAMSLGFTYLLDSNGDPWVRTTGDFVAQVSDGTYSVIKRLMELGLYIEVDPDTFEVRAYEPETHRRDRTGASWAADVVRFQRPSAGTVDSGNIKSDATREIEARIKRNGLLVGSLDTWEWVTDPGITTPWEGGYILDDESAASLEDAGNAQLGARSDAGDVFHFRMKVGDDELNGKYLPFEHVRLDDLVTVHTGTGALDYDEQTFPVAALTLTLRAGGGWDCWVDLGSTYTSMAERAFQAQPVKAHTHPPNPKICRDPVVGDPSFVSAGYISNGTGRLEVPAMTNGILLLFGAVLLEPGPPDPSAATVAVEGYTPVFVPGSEVVNGTWGLGLWYVLNPAFDSPGPTVSINAGAGYRAFQFWENINLSDPLGSVLTALGTGATAALSALDAGGWPNSMWSYGGSGHAPPTPAAPQTDDWSESSGAGPNLEYGGGHGDPTPSWGLSTSKTWMIVGVGLNGLGSGGDGPADTVLQGDETFGTGTAVTACDHAHAHGLLSESGTHYHDTDQIDGLGGVADHGALTGLGDDDHPQYLTEAEHTALDHSTLGHWEPVTNGDVGSPEIVFDAGDVVMEWVS